MKSGFPVACRSPSSFGEGPHVGDCLLDALPAPIAGGIVKAQGQELNQTRGRGLGRASLGTNLGKVPVVCRHTMKQNTLIVVGEDDHLTRVACHVDAPFLLSDWPAQPTRVKKTPSTRKESHGGAIAAISPLPIESNVKFTVSP
jgi:hypothetical protein